MTALSATTTRLDRVAPGIRNRFAREVNATFAIACCAPRAMRVAA